MFGGAPADPRGRPSGSRTLPSQRHPDRLVELVDRQPHQEVRDTTSRRLLDPVGDLPKPDDRPGARPAFGALDRLRMAQPEVGYTESTVNSRAAAHCTDVDGD